MNIQEQHIMFREFAQQKGMQTTRAILVEDIDIHLNVATLQTAKEILSSNVQNIFSDKVSRQQYKISPINGLRTLYRDGDITINNISGDGTQLNPYKFNISSESIMLYTGFYISYNGETIYDCRILEPEALGQTLRDFSNRATWDAPIMVIYGDENSIDCRLFTGTTEFKKPVAIKYNYMKLPTIVKFDENLENCINSDMPVYLHQDIVIKAVNNYIIATNTNTNPSEQ